METYITRDYRNVLKAETKLPLQEKQVLHIHTYKDSKGALVTFASVHTVEGNMLTHRCFRDYSKCMAREDVRCTEKNVRAQHDRVLAAIDTITADVQRHYASEPALLG